MPLPSPSLSEQTQVDTLRSHGYLILEQLATPQLINQVRSELEPWFAQTPVCIGDFHGWRTTRLNSILLKSRSSHELLLDPRVLALVDDILRAHCDWYQLNLSQAIRLHGGERQQIPHRDDAMWPCAKNGVEYMVNVMWALDDFTEENGATLLWPGAPLDTTAHLRASEAHVARMPAGSALVYLGSIAHCGGANRSPQPRTGLVFSYCLGWLKTYENSFLAYPPEVVRSFSPCVRDLLGYRIHRPNLGHYEGQSPAVIFETDSRTLAMRDALPPEIAAKLAEFYRSGADCLEP